MTAPIAMMDEAVIRRIVAEEVAKAVEPLRNAMKPAAQPMMDAAELAAMLGVSVRAVRRLALAGDLPAGVRIGPKTVRWRRDVIDRWLESGGKALSIRGGRA